MKKKILIVCIVIVSMVLSVFCFRKFYAKNTYEVTKVSQLSENFTPLESLTEIHPDINYGFFEQAIYFQRDVETEEEKIVSGTNKITIAQYMLNDADFLVEYQKKLYFNLEELEKML